MISPATLIAMTQALVAVSPKNKHPEKNLVIIAEDTEQVKQSLVEEARKPWSPRRNKQGSSAETRFNMYDDCQEAKQDTPRWKTNKSFRSTLAAIEEVDEENDKS